MSEKLLVSRCDRLGDLVLSLPALGYLRDAGVKGLWLHTSAYARPIGEWARHNGLVEGVWAEGEAVPLALVPEPGRKLCGLSLFHSPECVSAFRKLGIRDTLGPRTRINALWTYRRSLAQHRSRVEKSEMAYNVDLARTWILSHGLTLPTFRGLPALEVPKDWRSPLPGAKLLIVASNGGSAHNWPMAKYLDVARSALDRDQKSVQFLIHGNDAELRRQQFLDSDLVGRAALLPSFARLEELVAHIASCGEIFSSSTGPLHIAHAAGRPVTGLYPKSPLVQSFARWRPDGFWHSAPVSWIHL
jgi:ADP-heptose:LPS heptosyltransferase